MGGFFSGSNTPAVPPPPIAPTSSLNQSAANALNGDTAVAQNKKKSQAATMLDPSGDTNASSNAGAAASAVGRTLMGS